MAQPAVPKAGPATPGDPRPDDPLDTGPFHAALREAIRRRGLTLDRLRCHLARRGVPVALSTLSDWQHGHRRPGGAHSLRALRALEEILHVPSESLVRLLIVPDAQGREGGPLRLLRPAQGLDERGGTLAELLDSLPGARNRGIELINRSDQVFVDADRRAWRVVSRTVIRASQDGVDRHVLRYFGDDGCDVDQVRVLPGENCRLGEVRRHCDPPVLVAELLFGEPLRAGQTWVFSEEVEDRTGQGCVEYGHGFADPTEQYLLEVRFDPAALPVDCHAYAQPGLYDEPRRTTGLALNNHHAVHLCVTGVTAGLIGIAWAWP
jgi:hypothetical protein